MIRYFSMARKVTLEGLYRLGRGDHGFVEQSWSGSEWVDTNYLSGKMMELSPFLEELSEAEARAHCPEAFATN